MLMAVGRGVGDQTALISARYLNCFQHLCFDHLLDFVVSYDASLGLKLDRG